MLKFEKIVIPTSDLGEENPLRISRISIIFMPDIN